MAVLVGGRMVGQPYKILPHRSPHRSLGIPRNFLGIFGNFRVYGPIWAHMGPAHAVGRAGGRAGDVRVQGCLLLFNLYSWCVPSSEMSYAFAEYAM